MSESLAGSIIIDDMRIDNRSNVQYRNNSGDWATVISTSEPPIVNSIISNKYVNIEALKVYDKEIKEYIDARIEEKLNSSNEYHNKYKIMTGEE